MPMKSCAAHPWRRKLERALQDEVDVSDAKSDIKSDIRSPFSSSDREEPYLNHEARRRFTTIESELSAPVRKSDWCRHLIEGEIRSLGESPIRTFV
jgi:hypothetical protein